MPTSSTARGTMSSVLRKQTSHFSIDGVARATLLAFGVVLVMAGLDRAGIEGLGMMTLGVAATTLAAVLPRLRRVKLFGRYGLDARLFSSGAAPEERRTGDQVRQPP